MDEEKVELTNQQLNAILNAAYALINKLGQWFNSPQTDADNAVLQTLAQVQPELQRLLAACPHLNRQHTPAEINEIVAAATVLIDKLARTYPHAEFMPDVIRGEARSLFAALHAAGLIQVRGS